MSWRIGGDGLAGKEYDQICTCQVLLADEECSQTAVGMCPPGINSLADAILGWGRGDE